jgi:hypothetical protein
MASNALWTFTPTRLFFKWTWQMPLIQCQEGSYFKIHVEGGDIIQLIPFVHAFYTLKSPLFYSHNNRDGDVIIIPFAMGTCQGDPLRRALFTLTHFRALHFIASHFLLIYFDPLQMTFTTFPPPPPHCIVYIWALLDWTLCNRSFYLTS